MVRCRSLAVAAAVAAVVLLPGSPAYAHTKLIGSTPAAKSTVSKPVANVTLTFSGLVKKAGTTVVVSGPDKVSYSAGAATAVDRTVTQPVDPLPLGVITVRWRTVSSDGHPIEGSFTFTNKAAPPATPSPTPAPTTAAAPTTDPPASPTPVAVSRTSTDDGSSPIGWIAGVAAAVAVFGAGFAWWRRRSTA
jgi:methionine-rich copper-binding protein CopC